MYSTGKYDRISDRRMAKNIVKIERINEMQKETMSVHAALCEKKTLDKRIAKAIYTLGKTCIGLKEAAATQVNGIEKAEFKLNATAYDQQAHDMIKRQCAITAAINQYNASGTIEIDGSTYTIAEALWLMQYGMKTKKALLKAYEDAYNAATAEANRKNGEDLRRAAERAADVALGGKDKTNGDEYLKMVENYISRHQLEVVDPLGLWEKIQALENDIHTFESEVDAKIQTSNALTMITIEY